MHGSMRRREETSASRARIAAQHGRLPPTLPRPTPIEVSAFIDERKLDFGVEPLQGSGRIGVRVLPASNRPAVGQGDRR